MVRVHPLPAARRALLALLVATLLASGVLPVAAATPASAAANVTACPRNDVPSTPFTDTVRASHRVAIDCASWWGIVSGRTRTTFAPFDDVTRGQTAAMIARLLRLAVEVPDDVEPAGFVDTVDHQFAEDIDLLASLGIVRGISEDRFGPEQPIDRAQMASIIARMFELGIGTPLPEGPVPFADVRENNVHRTAIGQLVAAGITGGTSAATFSPRDAVIRGQMAAFLTRAVSLLVDADLVAMPEVRPADDDPFTSSVRAAWVHLFDGRLKSPASVRAMLDELEAADVTHVIAQVARRHDAYWFSDVLPRTTDPTLAQGFDVVQALVDGAHARGMEVHAWISVAPTWHDVYTSLPAPPGWLPALHGRNAPEAQRWVTQRHDGSWSTYLDPGVPQVQDHVAAIVAELAERYDIDGIHLDYVRYESASHGYNPIALQRYRAETGATGRPAPTDPQWTEWRREQTHEIIRRARAELEGTDVALSAAVISWGDGPRTPDRGGFRASSPFTRTLQDWDRWVRFGDVDLVFPMNYFREHDAQQARWFARWLAYEEALAAEVDVLVVPGIAGYLNNPNNAYNQIAAAMTRTDGAAIYSVQQPTLDGTREMLTRLGQTRWSAPPLP